MCGGPEEAVGAAVPLLASMGARVMHLGGPGLGQAAKLCNNLALGGPGLRAGRRARARGTRRGGPTLWGLRGPRVPSKSAAAPSASIRTCLCKLARAPAQRRNTHQRTQPQQP
jgi:hypothetical protein